MGEDLGPLSSKELESLERQLDASLKQIRSTRVRTALTQSAASINDRFVRSVVSYDAGLSPLS